ncbi:MAG: hypothetical protein AB1716_00310 [Planctomycetota bacterium]
MNLAREGRILAHVLLMAGAIGLFGGCTAGHRNLTAAVIVTAAPSLAEGETKIVLELQDARAEFALSEADTFLASDRAAKLSHAIRAQLFERCQALRHTLPRARQVLPDGIAIIPVDPGGACANGNMVIYVAGRSAVHVLFSRDEIAQLLAFKECGDDLATIRYTHPAFDPARLQALRDRVAALDMTVENVSLSGAELERLKTEAATRVLERYLRDRGLPLSDEAPLLTAGLLSPARSPRLTEALEDPSVVEQLLQDHHPNALRALLFLVNRKVIDLEYP